MAQENPAIQPMDEMGEEEKETKVSAAGDWSRAFFQLHERIDELSYSHQRLARLTKQAYQHSQQTWHKLTAIEEMVRGLITRVESSQRSQAWVLERLTNLDESFKVAQAQAQGMEALISGIHAVVVNGKPEGIITESEGSA